MENDIFVDRGINADNPILVVGFGNMGSAIVSCWLSRKLIPPEAIHAVDPVFARSTPENGPRGFQSLEDWRAQNSGMTPSLIMLAVKPQMMDVVLPALRACLKGVAEDDHIPLVSIAAGVSIARLRNDLGLQVRIVRVMPNTPSQIGHGMTGAFTDDMRAADQDTVERLFQATGAFIWLDDEEDLHRITALSGSGPAYMFAMLEGLVAAASEIGLPPDHARLLAVQTMRGAAELALREPKPLETLRANVTSPKGTTAAGVEALLADDVFFERLRMAVKAAHDRSHALEAETA
ncbi:MAG: pyrroline-5-carboxylate reductase [Pseudomonadota bacterium]